MMRHADAIYASDLIGAVAKKQVGHGWETTPSTAVTFQPVAELETILWAGQA
jgi:hypothetical protein